MIIFYQQRGLHFEELFFIKNINDFFQCEDYNAVFRLCDSIDLKNKIKNVTLQILKQDNSKLNTR